MLLLSHVNDNEYLFVMNVNKNMETYCQLQCIWKKPEKQFYIYYGIRESWWKCVENKISKYNESKDIITKYLKKLQIIKRKWCEFVEERYVIFVTYGGLKYLIRKQIVVLWIVISSLFRRYFNTCALYGSK